MKASYKMQAQSQKIRGFPLVMVGLILGMVQAVFTIPHGGGPACFVLPGALLGGIGMIIVAKKNNLEAKVKKGAYIGAAIFFATLLISAYHLYLMKEIEDDMDKLDDDSENINSSNWEEKKGAFVDDLNSLIDKLIIFTVVLAISTGLLAVGATTHVLMGDHEKKRLMFIPVITFIAVIIVVPVLTINAAQDWRDVLDDMEDAESESEVEQVADDFDALDSNEVILGSQIGGIINLLNLILVLLLFMNIKPPIVAKEGYYQLPGGTYGAVPRGPRDYGYQYGYGQGPVQPSSQPLIQPTVPSAGSPPCCNVCGRPLAFVPQYQRYYCYTCSEYR